MMDKKYVSAVVTRSQFLRSLDCTFPGSLGKTWNLGPLSFGPGCNNITLFRQNK